MSGERKSLSPDFTMEVKGMRQSLIEDDLIALMPYTEADAQEFTACWRDEATQHGYNYVLPDDADGRIFGEIAAYPFWVVAIEKATGHKLGVLRLSPDRNPDLAIWVYPASRSRGWGCRMYRLALNYLFSHGYETVYAGCFSYNTHSLRILENNGFVRWAEGDAEEISVFDGSKVTMLGYVCRK